MFVVEGLDLFGAADEDTFADLLHPNDAGNERMAARLEPVVRAALFDRDARP
jgi:lysophospholipase L1-like esterase